MSQSHGIAIAKDLGKGFIADGSPARRCYRTGSRGFPFEDLKVTGRVTTGQPDTDAIVHEPVTGSSAISFSCKQLVQKSRLAQ